MSAWSANSGTSCTVAPSRIASLMAVLHGEWMPIRRPPSRSGSMPAARQYLLTSRQGSVSRPCPRVPGACCCCQPSTRGEPEGVATRQRGPSAKTSQATPEERAGKAVSGPRKRLGRSARRPSRPRNAPRVALAEGFRGPYWKSYGTGILRQVGSDSEITDPRHRGPYRLSVQPNRP
jgi:hypothetical protein